MRFKLYFTLENPEISIQYRKSIISFFKYALSNYNEEYYKKFYNEKDNIIKDYTFSTYFKNPKIEKDKIIIEDKKIELNIAVENYENSIILYNAFNRQKLKKFHLNNNSWTLINISMTMEKEIKENKLIIKFQSPLCVRERKERKDYYYSFQNAKFEEILKINIKQQLKITDMPEEIVDSFKIKPQKAKKVMIKFYEKCIECSTGTFEISGDKQLLRYLYQSRNWKQAFSRIRDVSNNLKEV